VFHYHHKPVFRKTFPPIFRMFCSSRAQKYVQAYKWNLPFSLTLSSITVYEKSFSGSRHMRAAGRLGDRNVPKNRLICSKITAVSTNAKTFRNSTRRPKIKLEHSRQWRTIEWRSSFAPITLVFAKNHYPVGSKGQNTIVWEERTNATGDSCKLLISAAVVIWVSHLAMDGDRRG